jgi:hypothetical protein
MGGDPSNILIHRWKVRGLAPALVINWRCVQSQHTKQLTTGIALKCITMVQLLNRAPAVQQETVNIYESFISYSRQKENAGHPDKMIEIAWVH